MADGTVRGTFSLDAEPAIRAQRGIRDSAAEADQAVRGLGRALDDMAGTAVKSAGTVKESWRSMKDSISDDARQIGLRIDEIDVKLDNVSRKRVTPHIDVTGIDRAIAQIEVLDARLDALSRQRATPRVAVGGGFSGGAASLAGAGASGGGGGSSTAARAARGGFPTTPALIAAAGTAIPPLVGTTVGLAASASSAAIGAGELGLAGLGVGAAGIVPEAIVGRQEAKNIQQAMKDQTAYNQAVAQYGQFSKQAETAHKKLDAEFAQHPGLRQAIHSVNELSKAWDSATRAARGQFDVATANVTRNVARALPALRPGITSDATATQQAASRFSGYAFSGTSLDTMRQLQAEFARDLPHVEHSMENLLNVTDHLVQASLPYFHEGVVWIDHMTSGWSQWSNSTTNVDHAVSSTVTSLKDWAHFGGAAVRVVKDLFAPATQPGDSAVVSMTHTLDRWDTWLKDNPQKVRSFIHDAETTTGHIAQAVLSIATALFKVAEAFGPVLSAFAQLASFGSGTGLLIPSAIRYGLGKYIGGPGGAAAAGGGATAAEAAAAGGGAYGLARAGGGVVAPGGAPMGPGGSWLVPSAASAPVVGSATSAEEAAAMAYMMGQRPTARIGGGLPGGGLATPEAFAEAYGRGRIPPSASGAALPEMMQGSRFAGAYSALGAQESLLARAGGGLRSAAGGAARFIAPVLAVQAGIGALTTQGGFLNRAQGAASAVTFGLIPAPQTTQQAYNADQARAYQQLTGDRPFRFPTMSLRGTAPIQTSVDRMIGATSGTRTVATPFSYTAHPLTAEQTGADVTWLQQAIRQAEAKAGGAGGTTKAGVQGDIDAMKQRLGELRTAMGPQIQLLAQSEGQAYEVYSKRYGIPKAFQMTTSDVVGRLKKLGPEGAQQFAQAELSWARTVEEHNPKLKGQYDKLTQDIKDQFSAMGEHIAIVNGQIYTGSKAEWNQITAAMQDPLEKAREKMGGAFTDIQNQALGSLTAMGFSHDQATSLVHGLAAGGKTGTLAASTANLQQGGQGKAGLGTGALIAGGAGAVAGATKHATGGRLAAGGRLPGVGSADTVRMADGGFGAPGELVVNPFTEHDVSRDLQMAGKPTLAQRVAREWRPAYAPGAPNNEDGGGGRILPDAAAPAAEAALFRHFRALGGALSGLSSAGGGATSRIAGTSIAGNIPAMIAEANAINARHYPYLWGGGHNSSFSGPYDCSGAVSAVLHAGGVLQSPEVSGFFSSFGQPGPGDVTMYSNAGHVYMSLLGKFFGTSTANPGGGAGWFAGGPRPGFAVTHIGGGGTGGGIGAALTGSGQAMSVNLHGLGSQGLRGVPGALVDRGSSVIAAGMTKKLNDKLAQFAGGMGGTAGGLGISGNIMQIAAAAAQAAGLQFDPNIIRVLLQKESGGGQNLPAHNFGGILNPAGPFQVISSTFNQYDPGGNIMNPADNALAAMRYIKSRYGSLAGMASSTGLMGGGYHGYSLGGRMASWAGWRDTGLDAITKPGQPVLFGAGERRQERVSVTPVHQRVASGGSSPTAGGGVHVSIGQITVQGSIRSDQDIEAIGEHVAEKIIQALDRGEHRAAETT